MKIRKSFYKAKIKTQFFVDFSNFHFDQIAKKKKRFIACCGYDSEIPISKNH